MIIDEGLLAWSGQQKRQDGGLRTQEQGARTRDPRERTEDERWIVERGLRDAGREWVAA